MSRQAPIEALHRHISICAIKKQMCNRDGKLQPVTRPDPTRLFNCLKPNYLAISPKLVWQPDIQQQKCETTKYSQPIELNYWEKLNFTVGCHSMINMCIKTQKPGQTTGLTSDPIRPGPNCWPSDLVLTVICNNCQCAHIRHKHTIQCQRSTARVR